MKKNIDYIIKYYREELHILTERKPNNFISVSINDKAKFIELNLSWVVSGVKSLLNSPKYKDKDLDFEELFQEGVLALTKAYDLFDYTKGESFHSYASISIFNSLKRMIEKKESVISNPTFIYDCDKLLVKRETININEYIENNEIIEKIKNILIGKHLETYSYEEIKDIFEYCRLYKLCYASKNQTEENKEKYLKQLNSLDRDKCIVGKDFFYKNKAIYFDLRKFDIILKRYLLPEEYSWSFAELGEFYGCTKQQINLDNVYALNKIRDYIVEHKEEFSEYFVGKTLSKK